MSLSARSRAEKIRGKQPIDADNAWGKVAGMSFQDCAKKCPTVLKQLNLNACEVDTVLYKHRSFWSRFVPRSMRKLFSIKNIKKGLGLYKEPKEEPRSFEEWPEKQLFDEDDTDSVKQKLAEKLSESATLFSSKYSHSTATLINKELNPDKAYQCISSNCPNTDLVQCAGAYSWTQELAERAQVYFTQVIPSELFSVPFEYGLECWVFLHHGVSILEKQHSSQKGLKTSVFTYEYAGKNEKLSYNYERFENSINHILPKLMRLIKQGHAPLATLVHHVMLFDFYPKCYQECIWSGVEKYIEKNGYERGYTRLHLQAARHRLGHIRMYLIDPRTLFSVPHRTSWAVVSSKRFKANIRLQQPMDGENLKAHHMRLSPVLKFASTPNDLAWLAFITSIGTAARGFPLHMYLKSMELIPRQQGRPTQFFCMRQDVFLFNNVRDTQEFEPLQRVFVKDLILCEDALEEFQEKQRFAQEYQKYLEAKYGVSKQPQNVIPYQMSASPLPLKPIRRTLVKRKLTMGSPVIIPSNQPIAGNC